MFNTELWFPLGIILGNTWCSCPISLWYMSRPHLKYYLKSLLYPARWAGLAVLGIFYLSIKPGKLSQAQYFKYI
jgi:hypothetical protein